MMSGSVYPGSKATEYWPQLKDYCSCQQSSALEIVRHHALKFVTENQQCLNGTIYCTLGACAVTGLLRLV